MNTKITINGKPFTISDKQNVSIESSISNIECDEYEALAKSVESMILVDAMTKSMESYEEIKSTEAASIGDMLKKIWEKIASFFRELGHYIQSFITSKTLAKRAKNCKTSLLNEEILIFQ